MWDAVELAKYIVSKCTEDNCSISNLQLQGILYFLQKDSLIRTGQPLFFSEIQAWKFGPAVPDVYFRFGGFGAMPIDAVYAVRRPDGMEKIRILTIVKKMRGLSPWALTNAVRKKGGAWEIVFNNGKGNGKKIPQDLMKNEH